MKNDYEVKLYMSERRKGMTQKVAAARAGMSERTARKYEQAGALPSALPATPRVANPLQSI
jgi:transcriptional regulator with XRE-family HTH domain